MKRLFFVLIAIVGLTLSASAEVRLPDIMSSNMVLQQLSNATLWGYAEEGSKITIKPSWDKQTYTTTTSATGEWMVKVATPEASNTPYTISVQENKAQPTVIENVLIGEVDQRAIKGALRRTDRSGFRFHRYDSRTGQRSGKAGFCSGVDGD